MIKSLRGCAVVTQLVSRLPGRPSRALDMSDFRLPFPLLDRPAAGLPELVRLVSPTRRKAKPYLARVLVTHPRYPTWPASGGQFGGGAASRP